MSVINHRTMKGSNLVSRPGFLLGTTEAQRQDETRRIGDWPQTPQRHKGAKEHKGLATLAGSEISSALLALRFKLVFIRCAVTSLRSPRETLRVKQNELLFYGVCQMCSKLSWKFPSIANNPHLHRPSRKASIKKARLQTHTRYR